MARTILEFHEKNVTTKLLVLPVAVMCKVGSVFRTMCARNHLESNWCYCRRDRAGLLPRSIGES